VCKREWQCVFVYECAFVKKTKEVCECVRVSFV